MHMQVPTCRNCRIRSVLDALKVFTAVQAGILKMVTRRLDAEERQALRSGDIYAWEERGSHTEITGLGIERFTEGRRWSPSRVRDEFLFYYEKYTPPANANAGPSKPDKQPPRDWDPLCKQTYSVWVETEKGQRKWHLTAYFTQATVDQLGTVDDIAGVGDLAVPEGVFKSTRVAKNRNKGDESKQSSGVQRTYAPFPSPLPAHPKSPKDRPVESPSVEMIQPYPNYTNYYPKESSPLVDSPPQSVPSSVYPPVRDTHHDAQNRTSNAYSPSTYGVAPPPQASKQVANRLTVSTEVPCVPQSYYLTHSGMHPSPVYASPTHTYSPPHPAPAASVTAEVWYDPSGSGSYENAHQNVVYSSRPDMLAPSLYVSPSFGPPLPPPAPLPATAAYPNYAPPSQHQFYTPVPAHYSVQQVSSDMASASAVPPPPPPMTAPSPSSFSEEYAESSGSEGRRGDIGPCRDLAPLHTLKRNHPYRRDPIDDKALRLLDPRPSPSAT